MIKDECIGSPHHHQKKEDAVYPHLQAIQSVTRNKSSMCPMKVFKTPEIYLKIFNVRLVLYFIQLIWHNINMQTTKYTSTHRSAARAHNG